MYNTWANGYRKVCQVYVVSNASFILTLLYSPTGYQEREFESEMNGFSHENARVTECLEVVDTWNNTVADSNRHWPTRRGGSVYVVTPTTSTSSLVLSHSLAFASRDCVGRLGL